VIKQGCVRPGLLGGLWAGLAPTPFPGSVQWEAAHDELQDALFAAQFNVAPVWGRVEVKKKANGDRRINKDLGYYDSTGWMGMGLLYRRSTDRLPARLVARELRSKTAQITEVSQRVDRLSAEVERLKRRRWWQR